MREAWAAFPIETSWRSASASQRSRRSGAFTASTSRNDRRESWDSTRRSTKGAAWLGALNTDPGGRPPDCSEILTVIPPVLPRSTATGPAVSEVLGSADEQRCRDPPYCGDNRPAPPGTGSLLVRTDSAGARDVVRQMAARRAPVMRRLGLRRAPGADLGLTRKQAEAELRRPIAAEKGNARERTALARRARAALSRPQGNNGAPPFHAQFVGVPLRRQARPGATLTPQSGPDHPRPWAAPGTVT